MPPTFCLTCFTWCWTAHFCATSSRIRHLVQYVAVISGNLQSTWPTVVPRWLQDDPKRPHKASRLPQDFPKVPKMAPRGFKMAPKMAPRGPKMAQIGLTKPQHGSKRAPGGPTMAFRERRTNSRANKLAPRKLKHLRKDISQLSQVHLQV